MLRRAIADELLLNSFVVDGIDFFKGRLVYVFSVTQFTMNNPVKLIQLLKVEKLFIN